MSGGVDQLNETSSVYSVPSVWSDGSVHDEFCLEDDETEMVELDFQSMMIQQEGEIVAMEARIDEIRKQLDDLFLAFHSAFSVQDTLACHPIMDEMKALESEESELKAQIDCIRARIAKAAAEACRSMFEGMHIEA